MDSIKKTLGSKVLKYMDCMVICSSLVIYTNCPHFKVGGNPNVANYVC